MKRLILTFGFLLASIGCGFGQGVRDLVINELLVRNVDNYEDDYGHRVPWVEIYNSGYASADLASCFLTISSGGETVSYHIPKNDPRTKVSPQGFTVFFCEGTGSKGVFHTNFTLSMGLPQDSVLNKEITLTLLEQNGKDTISSVTYNLAQQRDDVSIGYIPDDKGKMVFGPLAATTPYATNDTAEKLPAHEAFRQTDPIGYGMAILAMTVVLIALLLLYLVFRTIGKLNVSMARRRHLRELLREREMHREHAKKTATTRGKEVLSGEIAAAIALALSMYENEMLDKESTVLTINRVAKAYSPWSSKLYGLTQMPDRRRR